MLHTDSKMLSQVIAFFCFVSFVSSKTDGEILDPCILEHNGEHSVCVLLRNCDEAKRAIEHNEHPQTCGFVGTEPIVCCPNYMPINEKLKKEVRDGHLARKACASFYGLNLETDSNRDNPGCFLNIRGGIDCPVSGGTLVIDFREFKHMALVGFDDGGEKNWQCGGSLISEEYVLTAAHCLYSRYFGEVKYVRLGDLNYTTNNDNTSSQDFTVSKIVKHPNYTYISHYNDIALLKLNKPAVFSDFVRPACLQTQTNVDQYSGVMMIAGWGKTQYNDREKSSQLRKAAVEVVPLEECSRVYTNESRRLEKGIVDEIQICAGSYDESNTCEGDSGGPLQLEATIENKTVTFITGVTAFGKACGFAGIPGVYTRVSNYVVWIENVVWK